MIEPPYTLIAELSYRCPLRCPYCSNPTDLGAGARELPRDDWCRVFSEAAELGVLQLHLTGGEPLVRRDLEALVAAAHAQKLYTNLITSGVPLTRKRLQALVAAGLDHVQLSVQAADQQRADSIAGVSAFEAKREVAKWVKAEGLPLTINVVLHRANLGDVAEIVAFAEEICADRLELANTQYHGFALLNRDALLPTKEQLDHAFAVALEARTRLTGQMDLIYVTPDYFSRYPRACMNGWGRRFVHIAPDGTVLPCHAARSIAGMVFDNVRVRSLSAIWETSEAFNTFRGDGWMKPPCRTCDRREVDFGGCRCQAFQVTGDAAATDPACSLSPEHGRIVAAREAAHSGAPIRYLHRGRPGV